MKQCLGVSNDGNPFRVSTIALVTKSNAYVSEPQGANERLDP
jgi:hypothetical protein